MTPFPLHPAARTLRRSLLRCQQTWEAPLVQPDAASLTLQANTEVSSHPQRAAGDKDSVPLLASLWGAGSLLASSPALLCLSHTAGHSEQNLLGLGLTFFLCPVRNSLRLSKTSANSSFCPMGDTSFGDIQSAVSSTGTERGSSRRQGGGALGWQEGLGRGACLPPGDTRHATPLRGGGVGGVKGSSLTSSLISALCQAEAGPSQGRRQSHAEVKSSHCSAHRRSRAKELGKETAGRESPGAPGSPSCPRPRLPQRPDRQLQELPGAAGGGRRKESGSTSPCR